MIRIGDLIKDSYSYYSFDFSDEGYEGTVINLTPDECRAYYHADGSGDEDKFRKRLDRMDKWLRTKPYAVHKKWKSLVLEWLSKPKEEEDDE